jgi:succinoglycan biosynthesis protein ExoM
MTADGQSHGEQMLSVTVFVPTYKRPENLRTMIPQLLHQARQLEAWGVGAAEVPCRVDILVVDNDPDESARPVVEGLSSDSVRYAAEPRPGVSAARNRAFDETSESDLLCCIDDDERPSEDWLAALVGTWSIDQPAAVSGRVVAENEHELDPFIRAGRFFVRRLLDTGTPISVTAAGNVLFDLRQIRGLGLRFDERLGLIGSEDTMLSKQLVAAGGRMVWCAEAIAVETVPSSRATKQWVLRRQLRNGNSEVAVDLFLAGSLLERVAVRLRRSAGGTARVVGGVLIHLLGVVGRSRERRARGLRAAYRGAGMIAGALGLVYAEYARGSAGPWRRLRADFADPQRV